MPNILLIGATGYIGQSLAGSLVRSGLHKVYGLARSEGKATQLSSQEVIPIRGSISDSANLLLAIDTHYINIVVDLSGAEVDSKILLTALENHGRARLAAAADANMRYPKLGYIYVSGTWVHGSSDRPVNDLAPVATATAPQAPARLTFWRADFERAVLAASNVLDTMVVRPALVYGRAGTIWSGLFTPLLEAARAGAGADGLKEVSIAAEPNSRPGLCHVDDVGSGIHAAIDKLPLISGTGVYPIFDLITSQESMRDILEAAARELGFSGVVNLAGTKGDLFPEAVSTTFNGSSARAIQLLDWKPLRSGYVQNMDLFAKSWLAARENDA